jgi:hypothetical protein
VLAVISHRYIMCACVCLNLAAGSSAPPGGVRRMLAQDWLSRLAIKIGDQDWLSSRTHLRQGELVQRHQRDALRLGAVHHRGRGGQLQRVHLHGGGGGAK